MEQKTDFVRDSEGKDLGQQQTIMIMLLSEGFNGTCISAQQLCVWSSVTELRPSQGECCLKQEPSSYNAVQKIPSTKVHIFVVVFPLHFSSAGYLQMQVLVLGYGKIQSAMNMLKINSVFRCEYLLKFRSKKLLEFTVFFLSKSEKNDPKNI